MKQVKFGVVGGGSAFNFHVNGVRDSELLRFTAIYDANTENAKKVSKRFKDGNLEVFETLDAMLDSDIDAVLVMVPHVYHEKIVIRCAEKGKHVLCEKPMGTTVEACRNMIAAAREHNIKFMIAENHRFLPAHIWIHDAIQKGLIGDVLMVRAYEGVNEIPGLSMSGFWKGDPIKAGGGSLMDMGAHKFAALEYMLGSRCTEVTAILAKQAINLPEKAEDNAITILRFDNGVIGEMSVSFTQMTPPFNSLEIYGTEGSIFENHAWEKPVRIYSFSKAMGENQQTWFEPAIEHAPFPGYYPISVRHEDEHFARCVLEDREPEFSPEDAMGAIECILSGYLSSIEKRPVRRQEILDLADKGLTGQILERLAESIPIYPKLPKVKNMNPVGYNKKRAAAIMEKIDLDLLIASSPVNTYYLSGLPVLHSAPNPILEALSNQYPNFAMIRREGEVSIVHWDVFRSVHDMCWAADAVGVHNQRDAQAALISKIKKWGLVGKRVGVESNAPKFILDAIGSDKLAMSIIDGDVAFQEMRLIKTDEEITRIAMATSITEKAIQKCASALKEGITDNELLAIGRKTIIDEGADGWNHLTLSIGASDPEAPGIGTTVKTGDIVRLDFGAVYKNYAADVNAEFVIGTVPGKAATLIEGLLEFQSYFESRIKPGISMKQLGDEAVAWYKGKYPEGLAFCIGHSIGLECEDLHLFGAMGSQDRVFDKNMVFEIEAWEDYEGYLIGVEDCYAVTDSGCRKMTSLDKHITAIKERTK
jgi:predicted dehydrogenase/Xaa-Pro aminopeptidase